MEGGSADNVGNIYLPQVRSVRGTALSNKELNKMEFSEKELTDKIIGSAFMVHSNLGKGFLEKVYVVPW